MLAHQDGTSLSALLSRTPFSRATSTPNYSSQRMILPNEEALLEDDENLQTQDAQFLPDEQISKFTELISEQSTRGRYNEVTDAQLVAEEEEVRRQEEEEIVRKRQAAEQVARSKGLISPEQLGATISKDSFHVIENGDDDGDSINLDEGSSIGLSTTSTKKFISGNDPELQTSSLNKPRNPQERFPNRDTSIDDYDDVNDFDDMPPTNSKDQTTIGDPLTSLSNGTIQEGV